MKRCKDCKYYDRKNAKLRWSCLVEFILDKPISVDECNFYHRKWWKLGRPK